MYSPLPFDASVPARFQSLLEITARYLPHDPWKFQELSIKTDWYVFFKYFREFTLVKYEWEKSISNEEMPFAQSYKIFSQNKKLLAYLEKGKKNEKHMFPNELMTPLEEALKKGDYCAFVSRCRNLNREALFKLLEEKITSEIVSLEKWEEESYRYEEIYNATQKRLKLENLKYMKEIHKIPPDFNRVYKHPAPVLWPQANDFFVEVKEKEREKSADIPALVKKEKNKKYSCSPF